MQEENDVSEKMNENIGKDVNEDSDNCRNQKNERFYNHRK